MIPYTRDALLNQREKDLSLLLERSSDYLTLYAEGLSTNLLSLSNALEVVGDSSEDIQNALNTWQKSNPGKVRTLACIFENGDVLCNRMSAYQIFGNPTFYSCYEEAYSTSYKGIRWTEPYVSLLTRQRTVALFKPILLDGQRAALIFELDLSSMLSRLLQSKVSPDLIWAVTSSSGALVATSDDFTTTPDVPRNLSRPQLEEAMPTLLSISDNPKIYSFSGKEYTILSDSPVCLGWKLMALIPTQELYYAINPLVYQTVLASTLHLLLFTIVVLLLGRYFTKPLTHITQKILEESSPLSLNFSEYSQKNNEVGVLARSLDSLIERIHVLMDQQKEMQEQQRKLEIEVLQVQIHPHFLGNTLACIQSLAKEGRINDVQSSLQSLVRLLNYSIARTDEFVTLSDEIKCLQAYIALRQIRTGYSFEMIVNIPNHHLSHQVPRLFLQPIIENCIVHGFAEVDHPGLIVITSYEHDGKLYLCVDDNGVGLPTERKKEIESGCIQPSVHSHGIGIHNVFERLRLVYGTPSYCSIQEKKGGGVRVILDLGNV